MTRDFFDRQGNPLTLWQWSEKFADPQYTRVGVATGRGGWTRTRPARWTNEV